jgi:DNA topoisomerase-1
VRTRKASVERALLRALSLNPSSLRAAPFAPPPTVSAAGPPPARARRWFQDKDDVNWKKGAVKWRTLEHAGVLFPPAYVRHNVPLLYAGAAVALTSEQEECATWYAAMKDSDFGLDPKFQENFFDDWRKVLVKTAEGKAVKEFGKCDFSRIAAHVKAEDAKRKDRSKDDKEADRALKTAQEARFMYALIDGRKEKVGNFRVEPPGLFRGRGDHPKRGRVKKRIFPEDITINIGDGAPKLEVPDMGDGRAHKWSAIVNDNKVTWLAKWKDSINGQDKCVWLAANSAWKGMSDMAKYNKARTLKLHIERVRRDYAKGMKDGALKMQQRSVAVYLIDQLALRVGNEKNTDEEADTVGCCSLRVEHVKLHADNKLELHFLGKDSIEFHNTVEIAPQARRSPRRAPRCAARGLRASAGLGSGDVASPRPASPCACLALARAARCMRDRAPSLAHADSLPPARALSCAPCLSLSPSLARSLALSARPRSLARAGARADRLLPAQEAARRRPVRAD